MIRYQIAEVNQGDVAKASGGFIDFYGGKTIHVFQSSGEFKVSEGPLTAEMYLVAGGGGSGSASGSWAGGGGGAGGVVHHPGISIANGTYPVTVGAGGAAILTPAPSPYNSGNDGGDSSVALSTTYTAYRGGGGGGPNSDNLDGGSGGGGAYNGTGGSSIQPAANPGATEYGNAGGNGGNRGAAGGGGAGGAGSNGGPGNPPASGGNGGTARQVPSTFQNPGFKVGAPGPSGRILGCWRRRRGR